MKTIEHYVIESWDLNDPNASHEFEITTEIPRGNSGNKPEISNGWLGSYNNITGYSRGGFDSYEDAEAWIRENNDVIENEDGSFSEPETIT